MPTFTSLSVAISARIMQMQAKTNTPSAMDSGMTNTVSVPQENEQNVLVWGKSNWGVEKVSSIYKP